MLNTKQSINQSITINLEMPSYCNTNRYITRYAIEFVFRILVHLKLFYKYTQQPHNISTPLGLPCPQHIKLKDIITTILRVLHIAIHCPLPAAKIRGPKILEVSPCSD